MYFPRPRALCSVVCRETDSFPRPSTPRARLYLTDRYKDAVRDFRIVPGPSFAEIAVIPAGNTPLERTNPRDLDLSADGRTLYVASTLGHTVAAINVIEYRRRFGS